jgi:hypothetical protein
MRIPGRLRNFPRGNKQVSRESAAKQRHINNYNAHVPRNDNYYSLDNLSGIRNRFLRTSISQNRLHGREYVSTPLTVPTTERRTFLEKLSYSADRETPT